MGNTVAQAIPLIISPILTRIYTPEDFGVFGLYIAIMAILSAFINGQYHIAIVLPVNYHKAIHLAALSLFITLLLSLFSISIIYLFYEQILILFPNKGIEEIIYFIPLSILVLGLFNIYNYLYTREKMYKNISKSEILKTFSTSFLQIILGYLSKDLIFLIIGNIFGFFISIVYLFLKFKHKIKRINKKTLLVVMRRYIDFPKINIFNNLLYNLSQYLIYIFITIIYEIKYAGFYTLIQRVMLVPSSIIGKAFSQVFFQQMRDSIKINQAKQNFRETLFLLIPSSGLIFLILYFFIEEIFVIVFGEKWLEAGVIAKILVPLFFTQFIRSSLNTITMVYEKQKEQMIINLIMLIVITLIFIYSSSFEVTFEKTILYYSISMSIINILIILYYTTLIKEK